MSATPIGHHGGRSRRGKARQMGSRLRGAARASRAAATSTSRSHTAPTSSTLTARRLGIPSANTFDYEWAWLQHQLACRAATTRRRARRRSRVERLARYGAVPPKLAALPGAEGGVLPLRLRAGHRRPRGARRSTRRARSSCCGRRPTSRSTTVTRTRSSRRRSSTSVGLEHVQAVVIPRTEAQRDYVRSLALPSVIVPEGAVDAQSLIALLRPRRLGRRDDEPRGGRARRARLHDLRRTARRRRRGADPQRPAAAADRPARARARQAPARAGRRAIRRDPAALLALLESALET